MRNYIRTGAIFPIIAVDPIENAHRSVIGWLSDVVSCLFLLIIVTSGTIWLIDGQEIFWFAE
jgi:hypothetical protein